MNQQTWKNIGNTVSASTLTATELGYQDSMDEFKQVLHSFNYTEILTTLARINLSLQWSRDFLEGESMLRKYFCSPFLLNTIDASIKFKECLIFNRKSTLHLLSESALSDPYSERSRDIVKESDQLGKGYLIANKLPDEKIPNFKIDLTEEDRKELLAACIPFMEYTTPIAPSSRSLYFMVRFKESFHSFQKKCSSSNIDVNEIFYEATGLNLQDYQYLIFEILAHYLNLSQQDILQKKDLAVNPMQFPSLTPLYDNLLQHEIFYEATGLNLQDYQYLIFEILAHYLNLSQQDILQKKDLAVNPMQFPSLTPLYDNLLQHICIPIDALATEAENTSSLPDEFRLWRKYPLVKISENEIVCIDIGFLEDKLETGVFWLLLNQLKKEKSGKDKVIIGLRGEVFEDYAASIIERGINNQTPSSMERYIIRPKYVQRQRGECTDITVCGSDNLILFECKAPLLSAKTKFSGDFCKFHDGIKPNAIKGVEQLWNAIQTLGHTNKKKRGQVKGIDISQVKRIYPVLILSDFIFSVPLMNRFLDLEFQRFVKYNDLKKHLEIMPLTVLTTDDLESLEPYLKDTPFHAHLDLWIAQIFLDNRSYPFSQYLRFLKEMEGKVRQNEYIEQEIRRVGDDIDGYLSSLGIID